MKRREFLIKSGSVLGAAIPSARAFGQSEPCPPVWSDGGSQSGCGQGSPAWFNSLSHLECTAPVSNWLGANGVKDPLADSVNSGRYGHAAIIDAWTGMGIDESRKTAFMMHNGGHADYEGNEVYSLDLLAETPAWVRRRDASASDGSGNITKFSDGNPCADHTCNLHVAAEGRWFTPGMASTNYNGFANYRQWWEFDPVSNNYIDLGSGHSGGSLAVHGLALWDPNARQVLVVHDNNYNPSVEFQSIDNMAGAPALTNSSGLSVANGLHGAVDFTNKVLLIRSRSDYYFLRIDTNANRQASWTRLTASGSAPNNEYQFHWHAASRAFITWNGSNGLMKLTPTLSGGAYSGLTWSNVSGNGITPPTSGPSQGMYNKINIIQDMGNGASALVVVPRYANPDTYVIKIVGAV